MLSRLIPPALRRAGRTVAAGAVVGVAGLGALGCKNDVNITNPNTITVQTYWQTATDAQAGLTAAYNTLGFLGTFLRWQGFSYDIRSDEGTSYSPWNDLQNFCKFVFSSYDFDVNRDTFNDTYTLISRSNQVIAHVPKINMDTATRSQVVAEGKFLRGLAYFHIITLFGPNAPLITDTVAITTRAASSDSATMFAQIEKDFSDAAAVLPKQTMSASGGHATAGAAQGMLGKTLLQERKWSQAAAALLPIINRQYGTFSLDSVGSSGPAGYTRLFTQAANLSSNESLFEVQMGNPTLAAANGINGLNMSKMIGPCGPSYCDGRPTVWFYQQFLIDSTTDGQVDPRLDVTLFRYKGDTTVVYAQTWNKRYGTDTTTVYWKKYGEYYSGSTDQVWDAQINFKVLRYADVLLMYAEAQNELGNTAGAAQYVNQVRARVNLKPISSTLSPSAMRAAILHERLLEFGLESQRWLDLGRQQLFSDVATLVSHDADFKNFVYPKSVLLPIPQNEINLNPNVKQNPGW
ncbi:membrane protein [Gemmatimonadetes bacterium T265]|nr:membrane protein [Gemmatimonadetes bacterium T265]